MHWSSKCRTIPVILSFSYASVGQPSEHDGSKQWWHAVVTVCCIGFTLPVPNKAPTSRQDSPSSRPLRLWHADTQDLQPLQASRSIWNEYCSLVFGLLSGIKSE